jgi:nucleotide-binding universal stress UspA family protein
MSAAAGPRPAPDRRHPYDRRPAAWRFVWRTVTAILVGLLLAWLGEHLVPSAEAAKRLVADAYLPWATAASDAPVLRWLPDSVRNRIRYADSGQKAITVLSVDDNDLPLFNEKWPPKLEFYASLIDELRDNGARAIFLDLLLLDRRPAADVQALRAAACEARRAGIPVFLASFGSKPAEGTPEQILLMPEPGQSAPCVELVAPHTAQDDFDHAAWEYPLCGRGMQSAALARWIVRSNARRDRPRRSASRRRCPHRIRWTTRRAGRSAWRWCGPPPVLRTTATCCSSMCQPRTCSPADMPIAAPAIRGCPRCAICCPCRSSCPRTCRTGFVHSCRRR